MVSARRLATASAAGTILEWYDFTAYNTLAALVFNQLFFPAFDPLSGSILAFSTYAVEYVFSERSAAALVATAVAYEHGDLALRRRLVGRDESRRSVRTRDRTIVTRRVRRRSKPATSTG